jgi:hypothetical protein
MHIVTSTTAAAAAGGGGGGGGGGFTLSQASLALLEGIIVRGLGFRV